MPINNGGTSSGGGSATWGGITGTLASQSDLNSALSAKQSQSALLDAIVNSFTGSSDGAVPTKSGTTLVYATPAGGTVITPSNPRQSIRTGLVDSNGLPAYITAGSGLQATLNASTGNPFICSFADGFDSSTGQALDRVHRLTANLTFTLTDASTNYLYLSRATDGTISTGATTLQPVYSSIGPASPSTGQYWFDVCNWQAKTWSGTAWVASPRLHIGEAVCVSGAVSSVTSYRMNAVCSGTRCPLLVPPGTPCEIFGYNQSSAVTGSTALTQFPGLSYTIPAGWANANTAWELELMVNCTNNTNSKQLTVNWGSTAILSLSVASVLGDFFYRRIANRNSLSSQTSTFGSASSASIGTFTTAGSSSSTFTINTAAAMSITVTGQLGVSTDNMTIATMSIKQINP